MTQKQILFFNGIKEQKPVLASHGQKTSSTKGSLTLNGKKTFMKVSGVLDRKTIDDYSHTTLSFSKRTMKVTRE